MSKQTLILIIILFIFTIGLSYLAYESYRNPQPEPIQSPTPAPNQQRSLDPETSLLFGNLQITLDSSAATPGSALAAIGYNAYAIPIYINTSDNEISVVQLEIDFDPNIIIAPSISPSGFFDNPSVFINQIDERNGRISYAFGASPDPTNTDQGTMASKTGKGTLATLSFQSAYKLTDLGKTIQNSTASATINSIGSTRISFLPKTFVVALGIERSALVSTNSANFSLSN